MCFVILYTKLNVFNYFVERSSLIINYLITVLIGNTKTRFLYAFQIFRFNVTNKKC